MEISALLVALLLLGVEGRGNVKRQSGPQCLECLKVAEAHDCEVVVTCEADEECFTEQYITLEGHIFFDLGCKSKQVCDAINKFGKRSLGQPQRRQSDGRVTLCEECCTGGYCNGNGCDTYNSTNRICYTCSGEQAVEKSGDCEIVTMCGPHEQCYNANGLTNELELRSAMGCLSNRACNLMYTSGGPNVGHPNPLLPRPVIQHSPSLVGRDISEIYERNQLKKDIHDIFFKRQIKPDGSPMFIVTSCEYCCDKNYCNNKECVNGFVQTAASTTRTTTHVPTTQKTTPAPITHHSTHVPTALQTLQHTNAPTTHAPTPAAITQTKTNPTNAPTTHPPTPAPTTTQQQHTHPLTTQVPTMAPTTQQPSTHPPTTPAPTPAPTTQQPSTHPPTTPAPTPAPTSHIIITTAPTTNVPTQAPTTQAPTTQAPTPAPTTNPPTTKPNTPAHLTCLECAYSSHEEECNHTSVCNAGEICFLGRLDATDLNNNYCFYTTGCMQKSECEGYAQQQTSQGKVGVYGDNYEYFECCATSVCNEHTVRTSPAHCKPVPQVTTPKH